ncbi:MAG TPA: gamma-glutamyltransferase [Marinagarivorans sp.]
MQACGIPFSRYIFSRQAALQWCCQVAVLSLLTVFAVTKSALAVAGGAEPESAPYAVVLPDNKGAIATVQPLATEAAVAAFERGGNAIDAALAAAFTLGVVDSHNSGIGGGCFIIARLANGKVIAIDGREMAPSKASTDMYLRVSSGEKRGQGDTERTKTVDAKLSKTGALAVGIPGSVQALFDLQAMGGKLSFKAVLEPAADLAEAGFAIDNTLAKRLSAKAGDIALFPATAAVFLNADGSPKRAGQRLIQTDLAASYRHLAKQGPDWFYRGAFAQKTAQWMADNGGIIRADDFARYTTVHRAPIHSQFNGYDIYGFGPPSSGGVHIAQMLNILEGMPLKSLSEQARYHLLAETMKLAFIDRAHWLGDADFVAVPRGLIAPAYAAKLRKKIDRNRASEVASHGLPPGASEDFFYQQVNKHTTHLTTADADGNWVAITTTLNTSFGSKVMVPGTGVLLNNQMDDFAAAPGVPNAFGLLGAKANSIAPAKRPLSSMSPTLVMRNNAPVLTLGAAGGPTIISQVMQGLVNYLALDLPLEQAIDTPRIHHQWRPDLLFTELPLGGDVAKALAQKGHSLRAAGDFGGTQAIAYKDGAFTAVTEPRVIRRNRAHR